MALALNAWLDRLENTPHYLPMPAPIRIKLMLERLNFKKDFFVITIGGTNGKGTTTHLLSNYYQQQGLSVGRFTSPHLLKFNERIAINDIAATDQEIVEAFDIIKAAQNDLNLTYFDYSFLAALLLFKKHNVKLACLEVGIGGRLDATNALDTDCAIITTIDFDHMAQLGTTREAIGLEKAGIMRSHKPCIVGDLDIPTSIITYAQGLQAELYQRNKDFQVIEHHHTWQLKTSELYPKLNYPKYLPLQNAATTLMSILINADTLKLPVDFAMFDQLLQSLAIHGRMQVLQEQPKIIFDVAHNPQSAKYLAEQLTKSSGKTYALFSALADKDIANMLKPMASLIDEWYIIELKHPRAATIQQLKTAILQANPLATIHLMTDLQTSHSQISQTLKIHDQLIIFGSFMLA